MGTDHRFCRWVRHRLPLLAGGDLGVEERRKVERHLIGCLGCRDLRTASIDALGALRAFAEESPSRSDAPSLWPGLALQIRQSRHVSNRPSPWETFLTVPRAAFGLGLGLVVVAGSMVPPPVRQAPRAPSVVAVEPEAEAEPVAVEPEVIAFSPRGALPESPAQLSGALPRKDAEAFEAPSGLQFNYDLDHGTPMGPGNRDPQHSY